MTLKELQAKLADTGHYTGAVDGLRGPKTMDAILAYLTDGPDFLLNDSHFQKAADQLSVPVSYVRALYEVESSGNPFIDGRPTILFEPHIFSRLTGHQYDARCPRLSSRRWNRLLYPRLQSERYLQLARAVMIDPEAGFSSASYGAFQILGVNHKRCGVSTAMEFAWQEAQSEENQLKHFVSFIQTDPILWRALRQGDWVTVAKRYNGSAYYKNRYDVKLAKAQRKWAQS